MKLEEKDFPLYNLLTKGSGKTQLSEMFAAAKTGADDDKYRFALHLKSITDQGAEAGVSGYTPAAFDKTATGIRAVFEDIAAHGHAGGAFHSAIVNLQGAGGPKNLEKAAEWIEKGRENGLTRQDIAFLQKWLKQEKGPG